MSDYDPYDFEKEFEVDVKLDFETNVDVKVDIEKNIDVDMDLCDLEGNGATLTLDVGAFGENTLTEVVSTVIATDGMSSVTVEAGAFVN
jgi:hypothetical protein